MWHRTTLVFNLQMLHEAEDCINRFAWLSDVFDPNISDLRICSYGPHHRISATIQDYSQFIHQDVQLES